MSFFSEDDVPLSVEPQHQQYPSSYYAQPPVQQQKKMSTAAKVLLGATGVGAALGVGALLLRGKKPVGIAKKSAEPPKAASPKPFEQDNEEKPLTPEEKVAKLRRDKHEKEQAGVERQPPVVPTRPMRHYEPGEAAQAIQANFPTRTDLKVKTAGEAPTADKSKDSPYRKVGIDLANELEKTGVPFPEALRQSKEALGAAHTLMGRDSKFEHEFATQKRRLETLKIQHRGEFYEKRRGEDKGVTKKSLADAFQKEWETNKPAEAKELEAKLNQARSKASKSRIQKQLDSIRRERKAIFSKSTKDTSDKDLRKETEQDWEQNKPAEAKELEKTLQNKRQGFLKVTAKDVPHLLVTQDALRLGYEPDSAELKELRSRLVDTKDYNLRSDLLHAIALQRRRDTLKDAVEKKIDLEKLKGQPLKPEEKQADSRAAHLLRGEVAPNTVREAQRRGYEAAFTPEQRDEQLHTLYQSRAAVTGGIAGTLENLLREGSRVNVDPGIPGPGSTRITGAISIHGASSGSSGSPVDRYGKPIPMPAGVLDVPFEVAQGHMHTSMANHFLDLVTKHSKTGEVRSGIDRDHLNKELAPKLQRFYALQLALYSGRGRSARVRDEFDSLKNEIVSAVKNGVEKPRTIEQGNWEAKIVSSLLKPSSEARAKIGTEKRQSEAARKALDKEVYGSLSKDEAIKARLISPGRKYADYKGNEVVSVDDDKGVVVYKIPGVGQSTTSLADYLKDVRLSKKRIKSELFKEKLSRKNIDRGSDYEVKQHQSEAKKAYSLVKNLGLSFKDLASDKTKKAVADAHRIVFSHRDHQQKQEASESALHSKYKFALDALDAKIEAEKQAGATARVSFLQKQYKELEAEHEKKEALLHKEGLQKADSLNFDRDRVAFEKEHGQSPEAILLADTVARQKAHISAYRAINKSTSDSPVELPKNAATQSALNSERAAYKAQVGSDPTDVELAAFMSQRNPTGLHPTNVRHSLAKEVDELKRTIQGRRLTGKTVAQYFNPAVLSTLTKKFGQARTEEMLGQAYFNAGRPKLIEKLKPQVPHPDADRAAAGETIPNPTLDVLQSLGRHGRQAVVAAQTPTEYEITQELVKIHPELAETLKAQKVSTTLAKAPETTDFQTAAEKLKNLPPKHGIKDVDTHLSPRVYDFMQRKLVPYLGPKNIPPRNGVPVKDLVPWFRDFSSSLDSAVFDYLVKGKNKPDEFLQKLHKEVEKSKEPGVSSHDRREVLVRRDRAVKDFLQKIASGELKESIGPDRVSTFLRLIEQLFC